MRWRCAVLLLTVALVAGQAACGSASCDSAVQKLEACIKKLNCLGLDPQQKSECEAIKRQGQSNLDRLASAPCVGDVATIAETYSRCNLDPGTLCKCP